MMGRHNHHLFEASTGEHLGHTGAACERPIQLSPGYVQFPREQDRCDFRSFELRINKSEALLPKYA